MHESAPNQPIDRAPEFPEDLPLGTLEQELGTIDLGDVRRNRRSQQLLGQLGAKPSESIPTACGGWDETRAAYRLLGQERVTAKRVLAPHVERTEERLRAHERVLCIQDTSELDYTPKKRRMNGLGPLNYESRWGLYLHPALAVTPDRIPLGVLDTHTWAREPGRLHARADTANRPVPSSSSSRRCA